MFELIQTPTSCTPKYLILGITYGFVLMFWSLMMGAGGHGCFVPLGVVSSPLGFAGPFVALVGCPFLWALAALFVSIDAPLPQRVFVVIMTVHYVALPILLATDDFGDWSYLGRLADSLTPWPLLLGFGVYTGGHVILWRKYFHVHRMRA